MQLETTNYEAGLVAYTDALAATVQYDQARVNFLQAKAVRYQDTVALFTALGGGWWNPQNSVAMNTE
jgi:outer membrane protein TolC